MHNQGFCQLLLRVSWDIVLAAHLTVSLLLCSSGSNAQGKSRPLKGAVSAVKTLQGSEIETRELLGGTEEENSVFHGEGSSICRGWGANQ